MSEQKNKSIGALWQNQKGMSGQIEINGEKINIVVFTNDYKQAENHPDYKIFIAKQKTTQQVKPVSKPQGKTFNQPKTKAPLNKGPTKPYEGESFDDDVPF